MISVLAARNLPPEDIDNSSDPYVRIFFDKIEGKGVFRTKTAENQLNPEWKEENTYRNQDSGLFDKHKTLIFRVMDCDDSVLGSLNSDDSLGKYEMDINVEEPIIDQWVDLKDTKKEYKSQIRISVRYPSYEKEVEAKENHGEESTMEQSVKYIHILFVHFVYWLCYIYRRSMVMIGILESYPVTSTVIKQQK